MNRECLPFFGEICPVFAVLSSRVFSTFARKLNFFLEQIWERSKEALFVWSPNRKRWLVNFCVGARLFWLFAVYVSVQFFGRFFRPSLSIWSVVGAEVCHGWTFFAQKRRIATEKSKLVSIFTGASAQLRGRRSTRANSRSSSSSDSSSSSQAFV